MRSFISAARVTRIPAALILGALLLTVGIIPGRAFRASTPPARYLVLIVADGFRPDYFQLAPMHHLHMLMASGMTYSNAWVGQLESETPTGHATIATGVYPRKHGVIGFGWRDPATQTFTWMPTNLQQLGAGMMEKQIEAGGAPSISDLVHRTYPGSKTVAISGEKYYAADAMGTGADYILYGKGSAHAIHLEAIGNHIPPASAHLNAVDTKQIPFPAVQNQFVARLAVRLLHTIHPRVLLVNLPGTDIEGHISGGVTEPNAMRPVVRGVDKAVGAIMDAYKKAGIYNRTDFVFTSDHGMVPNGTIVPREKMYAAIRATGAAAIEDEIEASSAGYLFLRDGAQAPMVAARLATDHFRGVEGALYKVESNGSYTCRADPVTAHALGPAVTRAYIDLCDTEASVYGPDVILPYREDTLGITVHGYGPHWGWHGGLSWRVQHIPLILSGPGVRHGSSAFAAKLVDIAPTVERLLGVPVPAAVDGVVLANALQGSTAADMHAQHAVAGSRAADTKALLLHSIAQHARVLGK